MGFILWLILATKGHLLEAGAWKKILIAALGQLVTLMRYDKSHDRFGCGKIT